MNISRRTFLAGITATAALLPNNGFADSKALPNSATPTVDELDRILQDGYFMRSTAIDVFYIRENLLTAYQIINPTSHVECAIAVWAALRKSPAILLEEYFHRREGAPSNMFDHKVLDLKYRGLPYTHRILFFSEQVNALVSAVIGSFDEQTARKIWLAQLPFHAEEEMGIEEFTTLACGYYAVHFPNSMDNIKHLYHLIQESYESSLPYSLCSGIVGEALRLRG